MKYLLNTLFASLFVAYTIFSFVMFKTWNSNITIPFILLIALGTWLFGRTHGLILILLTSIIFFALNQYYGDLYHHYTDRVTGLMLVIPLALLVGTLRTQYTQVKNLNQQLDHKIYARDKELNDLTHLLLKNAESRRMELGQELHDGIGQQLTGVQLLSSSLEHQLASQNNPITEIASTLSTSSGRTHNQIRGIARSLFPIRIAHVGLFSALNEMVSCYNDLRKTRMSVEEISSFSHMPEETTLQLYRICQESCTYLLEHCSASLIIIRLNSNQTANTVEIEHNGQLPPEKDIDSLYGLVRFRLDRITATVYRRKSVSGRTVIHLNIPVTEN